MFPVTGLTGVLDNPELFTFLNDHRLDARLFFKEAPFEDRLAPTLLACDPTHAQTLTKTLKFIKQAPHKMLWFAVLPTCTPHGVSLASRAGASVIFFKDQWEDPNYPTIGKALVTLSDICEFQKEVIYELKHYRDPVSPLENDPLFFAAHRLQGTLFHPEFNTNILIHGYGQWQPPADHDLPCPFESLKPYLDAYQGQDFLFFEKPILSGRCLTLSHVLDRGPYKLVLATFSPFDYSDPIESDELPYIREDMEAFVGIQQQLVFPFIDQTLRTIQEVAIAIRNGALHGYVETLAGTIDTYGSHPQETPYGLAELRHIINQRILLANPLYSGSLDLIPTYYKKLLQANEDIDPHKLWHNSHEDHFLFGPSSLPLGTLTYEGPNLPYNLILALTLNECFQLFRYIAKEQGAAAEVTLETIDDPDNYHFRISDNAMRAASLQRQTWFQPFAMEHPSIMLYESYIMLNQCGGQIFDNSYDRERGNQIEFFMPKRPALNPVVSNWQEMQQYDDATSLRDLAHDATRQAMQEYLDQQRRQYRL